MQTIVSLTVYNADEWIFLVLSILAALYSMWVAIGSFRYFRRYYKTGDLLTTVALKQKSYRDIMFVVIAFSFFVVSMVAFRVQDPAHGYQIVLFLARVAVVFCLFAIPYSNNKVVCYMRRHGFTGLKNGGPKEHV